jgi:glycosidase
MYAERGFQFIRLDAIAYLWKEIGTTCINLPQTHTIVQLIRSVLDEAAPHVRLVSETNIPHVDNNSYFGNGRNESGLVYNFALPPLVLHTFYTGDASVLSKWAAGLVVPSRQTAFLNFLASHDGIRLNPVRGILEPTEIENLVAKTITHGGQVSYKQNADGTQSPYELNINYFDALADPSEVGNLETQIERFMTAQAIMLCMQGVPGIYFHSLFGSRNWVEGVQVNGNKRAINREKLEYGKLERELANPGSIRSKIYRRFRSLLEIRSGSAAFHPNGAQDILDLGRGVFAVQRTSPEGSQKFSCLHNVTGEQQQVRFLDRSFELTPYETIWQEL